MTTVDHGLLLEAGFFKAHGHGNDYLVFQEGESFSLTEEVVRLLCHPHRGIGADGIVVLLRPRSQTEKGIGPSGPEPFRLRMFNPDGGEFERSGNGLRVLGAYLFHSGRVGVGRPFAVEVGGDRVELEVLDPGAEGVMNLAVEMGRARFGLAAVGGDRGSTEPIVTLSLSEGRQVQVRPVSMGNPHCVVLMEDLRHEALLELGPALTSHPAFPAGTNVQLARVTGEGEVEILIWERGVGRTASSGTSACAVAAACVEAGHLAAGPIRVGMEGGSFAVSVSPEMSVRLEGPIRTILTGHLTEGFLSALAGLQVD